MTLLHFASNLSSLCANPAKQSSAILPSVPSFVQSAPFLSVCLCRRVVLSKDKFDAKCNQKRLQKSRETTRNLSNIPLQVSNLPPK
jgi:hypothetical protein